MADLIKILFSTQEFYLHGTNSSTLWLLQYTNWQVKGPIKMMQEDLLAPFTGELTDGLSGPLDCCPCFGTLLIPCDYNLDTVVGSYASANRYSFSSDAKQDMDLIKKHTVEKLAYYLEFAKQGVPWQIGFETINQISLTIIRARMLGIDLQPYEYLQHYMDSIVKLYRVFAIIYRKIRIKRENLFAAFPKVGGSSSMNDIFIYFRQDENDLFGKILAQLFNELHKVNIQDLTVEFIVSFLNQQAQNISKKEELVMFEQNDNVYSDNIKMEFQTALRGQSASLSALFAKVLSVTTFGPYERAVEDKQTLDKEVDAQIDTLQVRATIIANAYNPALHDDRLSKIQTELTATSPNLLVATPFPIVFVCVDTSKITPFGKEYRAQDGNTRAPNILELGRDIPIIATSTENIEIVKAFLVTYGMERIQVVNFAYLQSIHTVVHHHVTSKEAVLRLSNDGWYRQSYRWSERIGQDTKIGDVLLSTVQSFLRAKQSTAHVQAKRLRPK